MLRNKLIALDHPSPDSVNHSGKCSCNFHLKSVMKSVFQIDRSSFASTVLWLEDQKIRQYKIEDREGLRQVNNLKVWEPAFTKYKIDLEMENLNDPLEELAWLLGHAVKLEYSDNTDEYNRFKSDNLEVRSLKPKIAAVNFFDNMDFNSQEFITGVNKLASKLGVPHHYDHLKQLEAVHQIIQERLGSNADQYDIVDGQPFPFEKGNDVVTDDPDLDFPIRLLRLLQIHSLRELQTKINETIVSVQCVTANPKTDTKLGRVGF